MWLHVDGAYGAPAVLTERGARALKGLERVDSLALDGHKWLFQPIECGVVLLRDRRCLAQTFKEASEVLKDMQSEGEEINFNVSGHSVDAAIRALKLWLSFKVFGLDAISEAIGPLRECEIGGAAASRGGLLGDRDAGANGYLDLSLPAGECDAALASRVTHDLVARLLDDGFAFASGTQLLGQPVMRMCCNNPRTTPADLGAHDSADDTAGD